MPANSKAAGFEDADQVFNSLIWPGADKIRKATVPVPVVLLAAVVEILSTMKGPVGRPRKPSTVEALKLAKKMDSNHAIAKIVAASFGEEIERVRYNLRRSKKRSKRVRYDPAMFKKGG